MGGVVKVENTSYVPAKLLSKYYIMIILTNFCLLLSFYVMMSNVAFLNTALGATKAQIGLGSSLFVAGCLFSYLCAGPAFDKMGMRDLLGIGLTVYLVTNFFYFFVYSLDTLLIVRFLHGVGYGAAICVVSAAAMKVIPNNRMGEGFSWFQNSMSFGGVVGPSVGAYLFVQADTNGVNAVVLILIVIALGFASQMPDLRNAFFKKAFTNERGVSFNGIFVKTALPAAILAFLLFFCYQNIMNFMLDYSAGQTYFAVQTCASISSLLLLRNVQDRYGENVLVYPCLVIWTIGLVMLGSAQNGYWILASAVLLGIGVGIAQPVFNVMAVQLTSPEALGRATGMFFIFMNLGMLVGPIVFGLLAVSAYRTAWCGMAVVSIVLLGVYYLVHGRKISNGTVVYLNKGERKDPEPMKEAAGTAV